MARPSGLAMIDPKNLDPFNSTSFGTGELILDAVKNGAKLDNCDETSTSL